MRSALRFIESTRLYWLLPVTPYAAVWARSPHSGGWLMVVAYSLLILFYWLGLDAAFMRRGREPRLALVRDRFRVDPLLVPIARTVAGLALAVSVAALLIVATRIGVVLAVAAVVAALLGRVPRNRSRFFLAEWVWAVVALIGPAVFIGLWGWSPPAGLAEPPSLVMPARDVAGTIVGGLMLGGFVLLCLVRDEVIDRAAGLRTTATALTRGGAVGLLALWAFGAAGLAVWGVSEDAWGWGAGAACAWTALLALWALGARRDGLAAGVWFVGASVTAVLMSVNLMSRPLDPAVPGPEAVVDEAAAAAD